MNFTNLINLHELEFQSEGTEYSHYNSNSSKITSKDLGAKKLFFDVKELLPRQLSCPYHYHSDQEEVFIIIDGEVTVRQNNECKILKKGDLIFFPNSEEGAHQLFNHTDNPVRYLDLTTRFGTDVCKYPDSNKINAGNGQIYKITDKVDYFEGEDEVPEFWTKRKL
ncbi:cupin domain-containing protein [Chengkuizengella axinellae]|uniref:Cupin domain-containing protein n=1 Tax=Chengkuizengella axinellae TaxID=3064388 RepID=A0ABT9J4P8_9BACL|nr:cupin domain-containing protein [Chengkuizengella sp. 2205SS18-9]MDP5276577.1 cupin domain-containing protein [Chengkuizengella sp. 2205SS18-9]